DADRRGPRRLCVAHLARLERPRQLEAAHHLRAGVMGMAFSSVALLTALVTQPAPVKTNTVLPLPDKAPAWVEGYRLRWPLRVVGDPIKQPGKTVITSLATGGWLRPDAADVAVQTPEGELLPVTVLSHDPNGETIIQFPHRGKAWYWAYGGNAAPKPAPKAPPMQEGVTLEVREWAGDDLKDWAGVRAGLQKS